MSDFFNFKAVYNEHCDVVVGSRYQFFRDNLLDFFATIDETPKPARIVADLEHRVDFKPWYERCKQSGGSWVGSATLEWPSDRTDKLAMKVALLRALSQGETTADEFARYFVYTDNTYDTMVSDIVRQIFQPTSRELIRYIGQHFDQVPASDRTVKIDHNSKEYADVDAALEKLETALRETNDFDDALVKEQRQAEVSALRRLLKAAMVRVEAVVTLLKPLVTQYATRMKDNIVGLAVNGTMSALGYIFGKMF